MGYNLERMITLLAKRNLIDLQFARGLIKQLLTICTPIRAEGIPRSQRASSRFTKGDYRWVSPGGLDKHLQATYGK